MLFNSYSTIRKPNVERKFIGKSPVKLPKQFAILLLPTYKIIELIIVNNKVIN